MKFFAVEDRILKLVNFATRSMYLITAGVILFNIITFSIIYHDSESIVHAAFFAMLIVVIVFIPLFTLIKNTFKKTNHLIAEINIEDGNIEFTTAHVSFFSNLVDRPSIEVKASRNEIRFRKSSSTYFTENKDLVNNVYLIIVEGSEYLLIDNLFDDFQQIHTKLESLT